MYKYQGLDKQWFSPPAWPTQRIQHMVMYRPRNSTSKSHVCQIDGCNRSYYHKHHLHRHQSSAHGIHALQSASNIQDASIIEGAITASKFHVASNIHDGSNIQDASNFHDGSNIQDASSIQGAITASNIHDASNIQDSPNLQSKCF